MRKITKMILVALMAIPFLYSCNTKIEQADKAVLATIKKSLDPAGFYGVLDNGEKLYPASMRVTYTQTNDIQRAYIYFSELEEPREGWAYNADVFGVYEVTTKRIAQVIDSSADTLTNNLNIVSAWLGGGFLNVQLETNIDQNFTTNLTVDLQNMAIDGPVEDYGDYYPLELGVKCYPTLENGMGSTVSTVACFYLGEDFSLENLGCKGFEIRYRGMDNYENEPNKTLIVTPEDLK